MPVGSGGVADVIGLPEVSGSVGVGVGVGTTTTGGAGVPPPPPHAARTRSGTSRKERFTKGLQPEPSSAQEAIQDFIPLCIES